jgi:hypothetical protein
VRPPPVRPLAVRPPPVRLLVKPPPEKLLKLPGKLRVKPPRERLPGRLRVKPPREKVVVKPGEGSSIYSEYDEAV